MALISESYIGDLSDTPVLDYLSAAGVKVLGAGDKRVISCLSPSHEDKNPSMSVNASTGAFCCHSCGASGHGVMAMYAVREGLDFKSDFPAIVVGVSSVLGMTVQYDSFNDPLYKKKVALMEALHDSMRDFLRTPPDDEVAIFSDFVNTRGLTVEDRANFKFGYIPKKWSSSPTAIKHLDALLESGLLRRDAENNNRIYCLLAGRAVFPICNTKGNIIALAGRDLTGKAKSKYINTNNSPVFNKSKCLYGLKEVLEKNAAPESIVVVEGYIDVISANSANVNAVATMGTAITQDHIKILSRCTKSVIFAYDPDSAGNIALMRAVLAALPYANAMRFGFITLPQANDAKYDPDKFIREYGGDAFQNLVNKSESITRAAAAYILGTDKFSTLLDLVQSGMAERASEIYNATPAGMTRTLISLDVAAIISKNIGLPLTPQQIGLMIDQDVKIQELELEVQTYRTTQIKQDYKQAYEKDEPRDIVNATIKGNNYQQQRDGENSYKIQQKEEVKKQQPPQQSANIEGVDLEVAHRLRDKEAPASEKIFPAAPAFFRNYKPDVGNWVITETGDIGHIQSISDGVARMVNIKNNPINDIPLSLLITLAPDRVTASKYNNATLEKGDKILNFGGTWHHKLSASFYENASSIIINPQQLKNREYVEGIAINLSGFKEDPSIMPSVIASIREKTLLDLAKMIGTDKLNAPLDNGLVSVAKATAKCPSGALIKAAPVTGDYITCAKYNGEIVTVIAIEDGLIKGKSSIGPLYISAQEAIKIIPDRVARSNIDSALCKKGETIYKFADTPWVTKIPLTWIEEFDIANTKKHESSHSPSM